MVSRKAIKSEEKKARQFIKNKIKNDKGYFKKMLELSVTEYYADLVRERGNQIENVFRGKVTKFGNGAHVPLLKKYLDNEVMVFVLKKEKEEKTDK